MCLNYFRELIPIEKRGKMGGITFLAIVIGAIFFMAVVPELDPTANAIVLAAWRGWSLVVLYFVREPKKTFEGLSDRKEAYHGFPWNRTFFLYFTTWFMFALVSGFGSNIITFYGGNYRGQLRLVEPAISGFSALITGAFSDWIGRKRVITFGFVSLGLAYAVLGLAPEMWFSWFFFYMIDGIAMGLLWVPFIVVLWGEISRNGIEKAYAIGEAPYFLTGIVSSLLAPFTSFIPRTSAFSLAALFLFVAVIPLMYVPETLPEKKIKERELKMYIGEAKKIKEKYA
jgi:MFS family permease